MHYPKNIDCYPADNDKVIIDDVKRQVIINQLNFLQKQSENAKEIRDQLDYCDGKYAHWSNLARRYDIKINTIMDVCKTFGFQIERHWYGHHDTYFFATQLDAITQKNYMDDYYAKSFNNPKLQYLKEKED